MKHCTHDEMVALCFEATYKVKNLQRGQPLGAIPVVTDIFKEKMKHMTHESLVAFCFDAVQESWRLQKEIEDGSEPPQRKNARRKLQIQLRLQAVWHPLSLSPRLL